MSSDTGDCIVLVLFNVSSAFDTIDHTTGLAYHIALDWFTSEAQFWGPCYLVCICCSWDKSSTILVLLVISTKCTRYPSNWASFLSGFLNSFLQGLQCSMFSFLPGKSSCLPGRKENLLDCGLLEPYWWLLENTDKPDVLIIKFRKHCPSDEATYHGPACSNLHKLGVIFGVIIIFIIQLSY